jgi:hypothetical protein
VCSSDLNLSTAATLSDNAVTNAKLRDSGALSVIGRSANSSGDPADISATAGTRYPLCESGGTLAFAPLRTAGILDGQVTVAKLQDISQYTFLARTSSGDGAPEEVASTSTMFDVVAAASREEMREAMLIAEPSLSCVMYEDFVFSGGAVTAGSSGTGATVGTVSSISTAAHPGVYKLETGTDTTGSAFLGTATTDCVSFASGDWIFEAVVMIPTLSDGTDTFTVRVGFLDSVTADGTDGSFVKYSHGVNSGEWQWNLLDNSSAVTWDGNVVVTAGTWHKIRVTVSNSTTSAKLSLDGSTAVSLPNLTGQPTGATRKTGAYISIVKSAGTTSRLMYVDYVYLRQDLTTAR